jgi:hypothetical protein
MTASADVRLAKEAGLKRVKAVRDELEAFSDMTTPTDDQSTDELLAELAELLRQRHGLLTAQVIEFEARFDAKWEHSKEQRFAHRLVFSPHTDPYPFGLATDAHEEMHTVLVCYIDKRIAQVEALLAGHGIEVRRPSMASKS